MKLPDLSVCFVISLPGVLSIPAHATVQILSVTPSVQSPQPIGTPITWTVTATDSNPGPLTFQFNLKSPAARPFSMVRDFNVGTLSGSVWTSQPFVWVPTGIEGSYQIRAVIKDFKSAESTATTATFQVNPLVTGTAPVVVATANPLVALFSAPSCASGSSMRVLFQEQSKAAPPTATNWVTCHPPFSMTFEIAGMYPGTAYSIFSQTKSSTGTTNGAVVTFTTGALPSGISFPAFKVDVPPGPQTDTAAPVVLANLINPGVTIPYLDVATDLAGNIIWYYGGSPNHYSLLARPLPNGGMLTIQDGPAWNPATQGQQFLKQIDLAGNTVRSTNIGVIQQQLLAMGAANAQPCNTIVKPAPINSACLGAFHHDAIQTLPNGYTAVLADVEKIFAAGTQGDASGLPADIVGDMIIVLNANWQVVWYFDSFNHASGAPQLDINRPAVLGETCVANQPGCPPILLLGTGIAPKANDWLHANSLYYWPQTGDLIWSARHQDWVMKVDYNNGAGTGNILWRMGPDGEFTFNNIDNDSWPWFSHQHEVALENNGAGPLTLFDNGNTRVAAPPLGLGSGNSRCMSLTLDESTMLVTPLVPALDLGVYAPAMGSAQLLPDGNLYCFAAIVGNGINTPNSYSIELSGAAQVLNIQSQEGYRGWRMPNLYAPPTM